MICEKLPRVPVGIFPNLSGMKKVFLLLFLIISLQSRSQTVFGYWYGNANVKGSGTGNNYLIELVLMPEKNYVKGVLNYYFKKDYRTVAVKGDYDAKSRRITLYNIAIPFHGSTADFQIDCPMTFTAILRVAQAGSSLTGSFISTPEYKYTCSELTFSLTKNSDASKNDSVLKAISEFKEVHQVWKPAEEDTVVALTVVPRKVVNYVSEKEFITRKEVLAREIEVNSDSIRVDVYDNGEIDGDMISVFYNKQLILYNQKLTHKSIQIDLTLDHNREYNELSMFAENLGMTPPNTALMVIYDGKEKINVPISANLENNGTLRIKKKKN